ncbi:MAG: SpoIIE family protein phosphatase [Pleurocapsa minor HA4230-MV1]|jgi:sigma-B regulation protein RsbU (phosphoserine phosphatase)|nr:SpoIIE family protein phosphatase [Pleurocapsa minor HA4230-MV1]
MFTDSNSPLSQLFQLRQELGIPINAIIGYSEMIIEEIAEINQDVTYLPELEQIRACGVELLASVNIFFDPTRLTKDWQDLQQIISNPQLQTQLAKPTQVVIDRSQQLISLVDKNFLLEVRQINRAANQLLQEIPRLIEVTISDREILEDTALALSTNVLANRFPSDKYQLSQARGYTVLVVDDSAINREILADQVKAEGYQTATAKDGKQAIQMIQTGSFDLILLDIIMPEIDGYQVLKWIRHSPWKHIPTIMISALEQTDSVVKCIEMGAEDYLTKPFNSTLLKARLGACLEQKRLRDLESIYMRQLAQANQKISQFNNCLQVENTRLSSELEVTQRLQQMLLPKEKELHQIEALEIAGFSEAAAEIGGDYYDVVQHQGRIIIGIGDVSGHGLESGVLMLMVQTAIRTLIENNETDPKRLFEVLNRTIYKNVQRLNSDKNISLSLVDYYEGILSISGQHEEILLVRQGEIERIDTVDLGFPLGLAESIEDFVFETKIPLAQSEVAVLYTDGITEAENSQGSHYGLNQLCAVVQQNWQRSAQDIRQAVIQDLRSHIGIEQVYDDITLVVLKRK